MLKHSSHTIFRLLDSVDILQMLVSCRSLEPEKSPAPTSPRSCLVSHRMSLFVMFAYGLPLFLALLPLTSPSLYRDPTQWCWANPTSQGGLFHLIISYGAL
jgi:hypothetical protein